MPDTYVYNGTWRGPLNEWHVYDGTAWRDLSDVWVYDNSAWRKIFEASSCACGTTTIDTVNDTWDPTGCTCQQSPKVIEQSHMCVRWNYTLGTGTLLCTKAQIQYNVGGGSYISYGTLVELDAPSSDYTDCSGATYEGYWSSDLCVSDNRNYRVRAVLEDLTVCDTGGGTGTRSCIV